MRVRLLVGLVLLLGFRTAFPQDRSPSATPHSSARQSSPELEPLQPLWETALKGTNEWAAAIRRQKGWGELSTASFEQAKAQAENGVPVAQLKLGFDYFAGEGVPVDFEKGVEWLRKASTFALAQFLLGAAYLHGLGVPQDFATGVDWLDKASEQGVADAQFQLGLCFLEGGPEINQAPARGAKWLQRAAEQGHPRAQQILAECYLTGEGVDEDDTKAVEWSLKAASQGYAAAQDFLGVCYLTGTGTAPAPEKAVEWFRRAADQGLGVAQWNLADCYEEGIGIRADARAAEVWWTKAAAQNVFGAAFHLGWIYFRGEGLPAAPEKAAEFFEQDARRNHVGANLYLGLLYWTGDGVAKDPEQARRSWREACLQGISPRRYVLGDGALGDAPNVESWWRDVAGQGSSWLQNSLAEFYEHGRGVPRDEAEALRWYRKAAAGGEKPALQSAAWLMATSGDARVRDGKTAVTFAQKALAAAPRQDPALLDTLAAAYAESGQFDKAVETEKQALAASKRESERDEFNARARLYESHKPYRADQPLDGGF